MIQILSKSRWPELTEIFAAEFDSDLPTEGKADIIADIDENGTIKSFVVAEHLMRVGQIHSENGYPRDLIRWLEANMPRGNSVIVISSEERFNGICEKLQMRRMPGTVYRKDF